MQMRVRAKEAKRKSLEVGTDKFPSKKRCDREERIAEVQLKAYWKCFLLPTCGKQAEDIPVDDASEDELIEDGCQETSRDQRTGNYDGPEQDLIAEVADVPQRMTLPNHLKSNLQNGEKLLPASTNARQELLRTPQASIADKTEADAKRRKLDPMNSGAGIDLKTINWEVEHAKKKRSHA